MSVMFNTDLDKQLDKLTLGERSSGGVLGPETASDRRNLSSLVLEWKSQGGDRRSTGITSGIAPGISSGISSGITSGLASGYSDRRPPSGLTSGINSVLTSTGSGTPSSSEFPQKSLLSSSLANERNFPNRMAYFSLDETIDPPSYIDIPGSFTDDHPEPQLLATSVGKDMDGRLIPSSSTISLLSLSHLDEPRLKITPSKSFNMTSRQYPPAYLDRKNSYTNMPPGPSNAYVIPSKNSYTNIPSKNSITHLSQQRLQNYHRLTSPPPGSVTSPTNPMSPAHLDSFYSTTLSIPIQNATIVPDSPNLDPTSLGGSPSRFWLTSQTPPRSLTNSYNRSRTFLHGMPFTQFPQNMQGQNIQGHQNIQSQMFPTVQSQNFQQQDQNDLHHTEGVRPIHISLDTHNYTTSATTTSGISSSINKASNSPILNPVQTPSEDPPMTPLYLNRENGAIESSDSYFGNFSSQKLDEAEEPLEEIEDDQERDQSTTTSVATSSTDANGDYDMN